MASGKTIAIISMRMFRGEEMQRYGRFGRCSTGFRPSQGSTKSPLEYIRAAEPIKVEGPVVASHGSEQPALGRGGIALMHEVTVSAPCDFCPESWHHMEVSSIPLGGTHLACKLMQCAWQFLPHATFS